MDHLGIKRLVRRMQDVLRTDPGVDGDAQRLTQIAWLLFFKASTADAQAEEEISWSKFRDRFAVSRHGVVEHVNKYVLPHLAQIRAGTSVPSASGVEFRNYITSDDVLGELVDLVDRLPMGSADRHIVGDVYEALLGSLRNAKNSGEFYTPRAITRFMVEALDPPHDAKILDPASGTGGFLISALEHIQERAGTGETTSLQLHAREKKALPHLLCSTNLLLHGYKDIQHVRRSNPLASYGEENPDSERFDVVLANPPFGGEEEPGVDSGFPPQFKSRDTSLLFVLLIIEALKTGGEAAIVMPDGFMFQSGAGARVREHLLKTCDLWAVVRLPKGVFAPYTGIETNLLFFRKGKGTKSVRFYEHHYPEGIKSYSKTKPLKIEELRPLIACVQRKTDQCTYKEVSIEEIEAADWSLNFRPQSEINLPSLPEALSSLEKAKRSLDAAVKRFASIAKPEIEAIQCGTGLLENLRTLARTPRGINAIERIVLSLAFTRSLPDPDLFGAMRCQPGWKSESLEEWGRIVSGATPRSDDPSNFEDKGIPWLTPADFRGMQGKLAYSGRRSLSRAGYQSCSTELLPAGTVLFSSRAPIGYVAIAGTELCTNQGFKSVVLNNPDRSDYLYYYLKFITPEIERQATGTTFKEASGRLMKSIEVVYPDDATMAQIVHWLDNAFEQLEALRIASANEAQEQEVLSNALLT